jgi:hypothetical protein
LPIPVTFNGVVYQVPVQGDLNWAPPLTRYLVALAAGSITPSGGLYPLTADLNFGSSFGLVAPYYKSSSANISTAGVLRLSNTDSIGWRNFANTGNLLLGVNTSNQLTFQGTAIQPAITLLDGEIWIGNGSNLPIGRILSGGVTVTDTGVTSISANYITNAMVNSAAAIAYTKLNLTGSILNTDIFSNAAIDATKIANGSVDNTEFQFLDGVTSSIQTQINGKQATGNYITALTGDVTATGPGSVAATLATVNGNVGSFGSSTSIPSFTVNAKGLITAASGNVVIAPAGTLTGTTLASNVVTSSLTSVGTITTGTWQGTAITVANGGTGDTSLTAYAVLTGGTTSTGPVQSIASVGTSGQVLTSNGAGALPTFQTAGTQVYFQTIQGTSTTQVTTAGTTFTDTGVTATITPSVNTHRIKVTVSIPWACFSTVGNAETDNEIKFNIVRTATSLIECNPTGGAGFAVAITQNAYGTWSYSYIDSPATTSATTYKAQFARTTAATSTARVMYNGVVTQTGTIILEEIV